MPHHKLIEIDDAIVIEVGHSHHILSASTIETLRDHNHTRPHHNVQVSRVSVNVVGSREYVGKRRSRRLGDGRVSVFGTSADGVAPDWTYTSARLS